MPFIDGQAGRSVFLSNEEWETILEALSLIDENFESEEGHNWKDVYDKLRDALGHVHNEV
jgi:hypothetical protein